MKRGEVAVEELVRAKVKLSIELRSRQVKL